MTTKLIVYQLEDYTEDYPKISKAIKSLPGWAKIMQRTWIVKSRKSASDIRTILTDSISNKGVIFVIDLKTASWGSYGVDKEITNWIKENLNE